MSTLRKPSANAQPQPLDESPPILAFPAGQGGAPPSDRLTESQEVAPADAWTVAELCNEFLAWSARHNSRRTWATYGYYLGDFCRQAGQVLLRDLKPFHVNRWLDSHPDETWGLSTRRGAITAVKRACSWAVDEGLLESSPVKRIKRPPQQRRERIYTEAERDQVLAACTDEEFRRYLTALLETGARPGEVISVEARHFDPASKCWVLEEHKTRKKTGQLRMVWLTDAMVELCRELAAAQPAGPLFRNRDGEPWTYNAIRCRFRRLRQRLGLEGIVAYTARHSFATEALERNVPIATVAELLGHVDTKMVSSHYAHLRQKTGHLRAGVEQARRKGGHPSCPPSDGK
jgi:integrase/recombinase XerD